jgi:hypothetical protein
MQTINYISPEKKSQIKSILGRLDLDYIWYVCETVNYWFSMDYPQISEAGKPRREYCRLYCQFLWRHIADNEDIDYSNAITNLVNMILGKDPAYADAGNAIKAIDKVLKIPTKAMK